MNEEEIKTAEEYYNVVSLYYPNTLFYELVRNDSKFLVDLLEYSYTIKTNPNNIQLRDFIFKIISARYPLKMEDWLNDNFDTDKESCEYIRSFIVKDSTGIFVSLDYYADPETDPDLIKEYEDLRERVENVRF